MREAITPENEEAWLALRLDDVTSTEASALFGMSPYMTPFELWHRKAAREIVRIDDTPRMKWGRRLQNVIAAGIAEDHGWIAEPMNEYMRLPDARMGSSFDWRMIDADARLGCFEIKNVDRLVFRDQWKEEYGDLVAPDHIEAQLQHQLHVSGYDWGAIGVLIGGNETRVLIRERDRAVGAAIEKKVREFWQTISEGRPLAPDYTADAQFIIGLNGYAEVGKVMDARADPDMAALCMQYADLGKQAKQIEDHRDAIKARIIEVIGDHEKVLTSAGTISAGIVGEAEISYVRKAYRSFRFTPTKAKKEAA